MNEFRKMHNARVHAEAAREMYGISDEHSDALESMARALYGLTDDVHMEPGAGRLIAFLPGARIVEVIIGAGIGDAS